MKSPSRSPILAAAAAALLLSTCTPAKPSKAEDRPVPPVPADVRAQGGDAVVDWMLEYGYLDPEALCRHTGDKARQATAEPEGADKNPLLVQFRSQYDSLPPDVFMVGAKPKWETVAAKLTPDVLAKTNKLENPRIYGINDKRELLIGDGGNEVPNFTLGQTYNQARSATQGQGLSLMTEAEYRAFNKGTMEVRKTWTWLESGEAPALALGGSWYGDVAVVEGVPGCGRVLGGVRRVLRVFGF